MGSGIGKLLIKGALIYGGYYIINRLLKLRHKIEFNEKVVLITGGSRGLGFILARKLASEGAKVVICARNKEDLKNASDQLSGKENLFITCDITNKDEVKEMISQVVEKFGSIDVLINNAGTIQTGPLDTMQKKDFKMALDIHFWGPFYLINEALSHMPTNGRIVNISSIGGKISFPHLLPYNTSKFALAGYSEGISAELRSRNIQVTTVYPGLMRTGSPRNILVKGDYEKEYAWFKISDSIPGFSVDAELAASKILKAAQRGDKTLVLTIPAKLAIAIHGISPGLNIAVFNLLNKYILPDSEDGNVTPQKGYESKSKASSSFLTQLTDKAAEKNNEK